MILECVEGNRESEERKGVKILLRSKGGGNGNTYLSGIIFLFRSFSSHYNPMR